jgi:hypothetical protein
VNIRPIEDLELIKSWLGEHPEPVPELENIEMGGPGSQSFENKKKNSISTVNEKAEEPLR